MIHHMQETGEWGQFFDQSMSPFEQHETFVPLYFPEEHPIVAAKVPVVQSEYIPKPIREYNEVHVGAQIAQKHIQECLKGILVCQKSGKPYKITAPELAYYITHHLEIPRSHADIRRQERISKLNKYATYKRTCMNPDCKKVHDDMSMPLGDTESKMIYSSYHENMPDIIYCQECFEATRGQGVVAR